MLDQRSLPSRWRGMLDQSSLPSRWRGMLDQSSLPSREKPRLLLPELAVEVDDLLHGALPVEHLRDVAFLRALEPDAAARLAGVVVQRALVAALHRHQVDVAGRAHAGDLIGVQVPPERR